MNYIVISTQVKGGFLATAVKVNDDLLVEIIAVSKVSPSRAIAKGQLMGMMDNNEVRLPAAGKWRLE